LDIALIAIRSRLEESKHELANLCLHQLSAYEATAQVFTLDGFVHHFQLACSNQLAQWTAPRTAPARLNAITDEPADDMTATAQQQFETYEHTCFLMTNKCSYCKRTGHFFKECKSLAADKALNKLRPHWKEHAPAGGHT
jgi:hypothetical protein